MYPSVLSLLLDEHLFPPLRCSAAGQARRVRQDGRRAQIRPLCSLGALPKVCTRQRRLKDRMCGGRSPKPALYQIGFKAAVAIRTPGKQESGKNGGVLLSEDASWTVLLPS